MLTKTNLLDITSFTLTSFSEVNDAIQKITLLQSSKMLIHIASFIHNTVLVQSLKKELDKNFLNSKIVLIHHSDKKSTQITVYSVNDDTPLETVSDDILHKLYIDSSTKDSNIKDYRNQLFNRYFTDNLTNLPNLYQLRKDLQHEDLGLILLKIDNFQTINNFYGFVVGDFVIEEISNYLKAVLPDARVYRHSGSEFAITISSNLGFYELKEYLAKLYKNINRTIVEYQDIKIYIDFTLASVANLDVENIFSKVSMALKHAQDNGLPFWIYEDRMNFENEYERNLKLSEIVRNAVKESRIVPYFQAIIDNKTSKIVKYECLARLVDENEKILSPLLFIPVAKKIKVYNEITKIIIEKAFSTFEENEFEFNINLSIEDIMNSSVYNFILDKLKASKASKRVTFELLESEAVDDFKKVDRFINEVKRYGAKIAIDDFGSGYSNFSYLVKMKTDYIKIDGSLIENIDVDKQALIVVETIVNFAKKLGVKTVAEYVHSSIVMDKVKELKIDYSQGFYIDEPSIKIC